MKLNEIERQERIYLEPCLDDSDIIHRIHQVWTRTPEIFNSGVDSRRLSESVG